MAETALAVTTLFTIVWKLVGISVGVWIMMFIWTSIIIFINHKLR